MQKAQVAILMGSKSDLPTMEEGVKILSEFRVGHEVKILSAHRTPKETAQYAEEAKAKGIKVFICGAGGAAALAGVVAAHTDLPVIGVPIESVLNGLDSLLSTVQMPPGVPVGTVGIGKAGAKNAALLTLRILALSDEGLSQGLARYRDEQRKKVLES